MVITGTAIFVEPGSFEKVQGELRSFPEVTFCVASESGTELVVNMEADNHYALEELCGRLKARIPEIIDITHVYVNFEEEVEKLVRGGRPGRPTSGSGLILNSLGVLTGLPFFARRSERGGCPGYLGGTRFLSLKNFFSFLNFTLSYLRSKYRATRVR